MGLATVYGIVSQCNGFIDVKSEKGKGTTIIICLPLELHGTAAEPTEKAEPSMPHGKGSILLVEDQPDILQLCKQMLDHSGYHVLPALRPLQAIQLAEQYKEKIELLVTDVIMPEMNGHVLFRKLQRVCPQLKVLYMSGYTADFLDNHIASDKGVNFIEKPFSMNAFTNAIQKALKPNL
jgi:DNA-binding NtrC family response regulator